MKGRYDFDIEEAKKEFKRVEREGVIVFVVMLLLSTASIAIVYKIITDNLPDHVTLGFMIFCVVLWILFRYTMVSWHKRYKSAKNKVEWLSGKLKDDE